MSSLLVQRASLDASLGQMRVRLSPDSRVLLSLQQYSPSTIWGRLGSNSGQARGVRVGHLIASKVIEDIISAGYAVIGTYSASELDKKVEAAKHEYGEENVHVLSLAELAQIDGGNLGHNVHYVFVRNELTDGDGLSHQEALWRMFVQPRYDS